MYDAYMRIFGRLGLEFRAVAADTGSIGGSRSHEFQVIADTGEDLLVYNPDSQYAANIELAEAPGLLAERAPASPPLEAVPTSGEGLLAYSPDSQSAAQIGLAEAPGLRAERAPASQPLEAVPTPGAAKCEDVARLLGLPLERTLKSIVLATEPEPGKVQVWLLLLRGDHELNEIKAGKLPGLAGFRFATEDEIVAHFGCKPGYLGPIGTVLPVRV